jgi:hypothetical protein
MYPSQYKSHFVLLIVFTEISIFGQNLESWFIFIAFFYISGFESYEYKSR